MTDRGNRTLRSTLCIFMVLLRDHTHANCCTGRTDRVRTGGRRGDRVALGVNYPALLPRSRSALAQSLRTGLSVDFGTCRPIPVWGVASMHADGSRAGVFVPTSLLRTKLQRQCGTDAPKPEWSAHSTLIPGGLERARLRCRDAPSSPSSGPVYGGPYIGSGLAPMHYSMQRFLGQKRLRTRFLPGLLARFARSLRPGPPRYHAVNRRRWDRRPRHDVMREPVY